LFERPFPTPSHSASMYSGLWMDLERFEYLIVDPGRILEKLYSDRIVVKLTKVYSETFWPIS